MKKNIFSMLALAVMSLGFTACDQDAEGPKFDNDLNSSVAFEDESLVGFVEPGDQEIVVNVFRLSDTEAVTVPLIATVADPNAGISVDPSVSFAEGEKESSFKIRVADTSVLQADKKYSVAVRFALENALPSVTGALDVTVRVKPSFVEFGWATAVNWLFGEWDVEVLKDKSANIFKIPDYIADNYDFEFSCNSDITSIDFDPMPTGYVHSSYGMITMSSLGTDYVEFQPTDEDGNNINLLAIGTTYTVSAGSFGENWDLFYLENNPLAK